MLLRTIGLPLDQEWASNPSQEFLLQSLSSTQQQEVQITCRDHRSTHHLKPRLVQHTCQLTTRPIPELPRHLSAMAGQKPLSVNCYSCAVYSNDTSIYLSVMAGQDHFQLNVFFKKWANPGLFLFIFVLSTLQRTRGIRMLDADETTELLRPPFQLFVTLELLTLMTPVLIYRSWQIRTIFS